MCLTEQLLYLGICLTICKNQGQACEHWHGDYNVHSYHLIRLISEPLFLKNVGLARLIEISVDRSIYKRKTIIDMKIQKSVTFNGYFVYLFN